MKVLVFGNLLVEKDNLPLKLIPRLKNEFHLVDFIELDPTEDLQRYGRNLIIIDNAADIEETKILELNSLEDFTKIQADKIYSMHDFDLGYNLKLLKKMDLIEGAKIICVPMEISEEKAFSQIQLILRKWVAQDMQGS